MVFEVPRISGWISGRYYEDFKLRSCKFLKTFQREHSAGSMEDEIEEKLTVQGWTSWVLGIGHEGEQQRKPFSGEGNYVGSCLLSLSDLLTY